MKAEIGSSDHRHEALLATSTPSALGKKSSITQYKNQL